MTTRVGDLGRRTLIQDLTPLVTLILAGTTAVAAQVLTSQYDNARTSAAVKSEFIFETAPFPSCHASTIVETPSGLVAAWFGGTAEKNPDVGIWVSRRVDGHWTVPVEVADGVQSPARRYPTWHPVLFQPKTGSLHLFFK